MCCVCRARWLVDVAGPTGPTKTWPREDGAVLGPGLLCSSSTIRYSVTVNISRFHREARGSIPRTGVLSPRGKGDGTVRCCVMLLGDIGENYFWCFVHFRGKCCSREGAALVLALSVCVLACSAKLLGALVLHPRMKHPQ